LRHTGGSEYSGSGIVREYTFEHGGGRVPRHTGGSEYRRIIPEYSLSKTVVVGC
jgi:hypothetical protein